MGGDQNRVLKIWARKVEPMGLIVQKYGGTSVADIDRIRHVAKRIIKTHKDGNDVVVILSAMAGVTDRLISLAHQAAEKPDKREMDVLLATGEQTTAALLAMMLTEMNLHLLYWLNIHYQHQG